MANRYWVGGTDTWDATAGTKWANTSGGAGGVPVPTTADTVILDAAAGAGTITLGSGYNPSVLTLSMTFFTGTLAFGSQNISLNATSGTIFTGGTAMTVTGTPVINCVAGGAGTRTINAGGVGTTEANAISINVTSGSDTITLTTNHSFKNLDFTGFTGTFTSSNHILYGSLTLGAGMTATDGTGVYTFASTLVQQNITSNGVTLGGPVTINSTQTVQIQDALTLNSGRTFTLTAGTLDLKNLTLTTGIFSSSNSNTRSIAFGTGNITLTGNNATIWNIATATNFSYTGTPSVNCTYAGSTGTRTIRQGSTAGGSESNSVNFNISAGSDTTDVGRFVKNLIFTGFTGTLSNTVTNNIYGNLTLSSGMTLTAGTNATTFGATSGTQQITTAGQTIDFPLTFNGIGGTFAFQDALTQGSTRAFTITNGTVQLKNGVTSTVGAFATSGTTQKYLQSTVAGSQATLSQASGTVNASYLTIRDINATGGATWNALLSNNNFNGGNNNGWDFGVTPITFIELNGVKLRSFTEHGRF